MEKKRPLLIAAITLLGLIGMGACGGTDPGPVGGERLRITGMFLQEDQFFRLIQFGMKDAADSLGAELLLASSEGKLDKEIQLVNTYIARQVDAIVLSPLSRTAPVTALDRARDAGIKVVTYNSTVEGEVPVSFIESDQSLGSRRPPAATSTSDWEGRPRSRSLPSSRSCQSRATLEPAASRAKSPT